MTTDASRRAALLVAYMHPACALLAPCRADASVPKLTTQFRSEPLENSAQILHRRRSSGTVIRSTHSRAWHPHWGGTATLKHATARGRRNTGLPGTATGTDLFEIRSMMRHIRPPEDACRRKQGHSPRRMSATTAEREASGNLWQESVCIRRAMHPRDLHCSSVKYRRYSQSSRLVRDGRVAERADEASAAFVGPRRRTNQLVSVRCRTFTMGC